MINKLSLILLASATLCMGQSALTTPDSDSPPSAQRSTDAGATQQARPQSSGQSDRRNLRDGTDSTMPALQGTEIPGRPGRASRIVGPLKTKSDFEKFAEDATGRSLPVYGRQLFDQVPSTFAPVENVPVPANYVIGPGDQLLIRAWGKIELNSRATVDRNGQINLPRIGTLTVAGLRYEQLQGYIHTAIGALFKDFELNVSLGELRSIQIFILGHARQPGSYTVGSLSTLVDALFVSGGPSATGTMRRIQLRRPNQPAAEFDLYDLIERGDKSHDVRLLPGDVIFIPAIGPQIAISGGVNQPGIYELKGESTVSDALADAGGLTSLADAERAVLERIEDHRSRAVQQFALNAEGLARPLKDGDLLRVFPLSPKIANAITLRGNVAQPGTYSWKEGMRVSDLIPSRASLITRGYWNEQNHLVRPEPKRPFAGRTEQRKTVSTASTAGMQIGDRAGKTDADSTDDLVDELSEDYSEDSRARPRTDRPRTDLLQIPRGDQSEDTASKSDLAVGKNSASLNWEYALIERLNERDLSTMMIPFRLASAIDDLSSADNQLLRPGDVVTVFARKDIELPMEKHASFVRVGGEVNAPGIYRVNPGETLRGVVQRAGGLTNHSYLYAAIFTRESTRLSQEKQLKQSADQMQRELTTRFANSAQQTGQNAASQQTQLALQQSALAQLSSIKPTGRVVLSMNPTAAAMADVPDLQLEDGDAFYIPPRPSTVQVTGAVYNANAFRYEPAERLVSYLNAAGGPTRDADSKRIFVIRADGTVIGHQSRNAHMHGKFENLRLLPGDAIVVPDKIRVSSKMAELLQTTQFLSQLGLTAAALSVIK